MPCHWPQATMGTPINSRSIGPVYGGGLGGVADRVADGQGTDSAALDVSGRGLAVLGTEVESALDGHARSGRKAIA